ncbi:MAG: trypsin-like peptidase domain-containing protein [Alphaproteobacteria bacterium]|nr:MAG: trypsin-like peptidase domain-containing protein [Alphaproteobacteria bacterium]
MNQNKIDQGMIMRAQIRRSSRRRRMEMERARCHQRQDAHVQAFVTREYQIRRMGVLIGLMVGLALILAVMPLRTAHACEASEGVASAVFDKVSHAVVAVEGRQGSNQVFGAAFFWDNQGTLMTSGHVVGEGMVVRLAGGQTVTPTLIGVDRESDVALLRLPASVVSAALPATTATASKVGQPVLALGNPFGVGVSLSRGIISGLNRTISTGPGRSIMGTVQTDASLNPGNSGGPLLNMCGQLIGMNATIISPAGGTNTGVGFALPVEKLRLAAARILSNARQTASSIDNAAIEPSHGILLAQSDPVHARSSMSSPAASTSMAAPLGFVGRVQEGVPGVIVVKVDPQSRAERGGSLPGDVIVSANGRHVRSHQDLSAALNEGAQEVVLGIHRAGQTHQLRIGADPVSWTEAGRN